MARRKRKRRPRKDPAGAGRSPNPPAPEPQARSRRSNSDPNARPPAPWGSFPLVELMVLVALILLVTGFVLSNFRGNVMVAGGLVLGALAGLELSVREHFAGYRSHTLLLAGTAGVLTVGALFALLPDIAPVSRLIAGAAVFALATVWLRRAFQRRSGGASFRVS